LERYPTTIPPTIPDIIPENNGAPEAIAIPKHNGSATKNTTNPDGKSYFRLAKRFIFFDIIYLKFSVKTHCNDFVVMTKQARLGLGKVKPASNPILKRLR